LWPDFTRTDLLRAVLEYQKRDRRYGGLSGADRTGSVKTGDETLIEALRSS
jgi:undecaprenyl diphosphate synthase